MLEKVIETSGKPFAVAADHWLFKEIVKRRFLGTSNGFANQSNPVKSGLANKEKSLVRLKARFINLTAKRNEVLVNGYLKHPKIIKPSKAGLKLDLPQQKTLEKHLIRTA